MQENKLFNMEQTLKEAISIERIKDAGFLLSQPTEFYKQKIGKGEESLNKAVIFFLYFHIIGALLLVLIQKGVGNLPLSPVAYIISGMIFPFAASVPLVVAWRLVKIKSKYIDVLCMFLYAHAIASLIAILGLSALIAGVEKDFEYWVSSLRASLALLVVWQLAAWHAMANYYRASLIRATFALLLFIAAYWPVSNIFMGLSTLTGSNA
jgi:hypothetical protein